MNLIKVLITIGVIALMFSCKSRPSVGTEEDLFQDSPSLISPDHIENIDYPIFDYSTIIERFRKDQLIGAADLIDKYADKLDDFVFNLESDQKAEVRELTGDLKLLAKQVRSKKIKDADELLSECMIIDRNIGEVLSDNAQVTAEYNDPSLLEQELKFSIDLVRTSLSKLNNVQKINANKMIIQTQNLLNNDATETGTWTSDMIRQLEINNIWLAKNLPEDLK